MIGKIEFVAVFDHMVRQIAECQIVFVSTEVQVLFTAHALQTHLSFVVLLLVDSPVVLTDEEIILEFEWLFAHICYGKAIVKATAVSLQRFEHVLWLFKELSIAIANYGKGQLYLGSV